EGRTYVHPLKVWERYSPTMFFPNLIDGDEAVCITASTEAAELFSRLRRAADRQDPWEATIERARAALDDGPEAQAEAAKDLRAMIIGGSTRMARLAERYLGLPEL